MEKGIVIDIKQNKMTVRFAANEACKKCGACDVKEGKSFLRDIDNSVDAVVGDTVFIETVGNNLVKAASIIYLIPVVAIIGGYFVGLFFLNLFNIAEKFAVFSALLAFAASFFVISRIDKKLANNINFKPVVVKKQ